MSEKLYQQFYKPYGMFDEEYENKKRIVAEKLAGWEQEQNEGNLPDLFATLPITVTVCDSCYRASCIQGEFYCENYKTAGTKEITIEELKKLNLENSDYWHQSQ